MSIEFMNLVWKDHSGNLTATEKSVLLRLADFAAHDGTRIYPSIRTIELDTSNSHSTVIRTLKSLEQKGYLKKTIRKKGVINITNLYRINLKKLSSPYSGGSVTMTQGVVSSRYQGSVTMTPDPSHDPSDLNNNNNNKIDTLPNGPRRTAKKSVVVEKKIKNGKESNKSPRRSLKRMSATIHAPIIKKTPQSKPVKDLEPKITRVESEFLEFKEMFDSKGIKPETYHIWFKRFSADYIREKIFITNAGKRDDWNGFLVSAIEKNFPRQIAHNPKAAGPYGEVSPEIKKLQDARLKRFERDSEMSHCKKMSELCNGVEKDFWMRELEKVEIKYANM